MVDGNTVGAAAKAAGAAATICVLAIGMDEIVDTGAAGSMPTVEL